MSDLFPMRFYFVIIIFFGTLAGMAQDVEKDFDAIDSLYREDQFYINITYNTMQKGPGGLRQNKLSPGIAGGFLRDMPFNKKRTLSIAAGLGYSLEIYNHNLSIVESNGSTTYSLLNQDDITFSKNKFSLHFLELPIEFRWRNSTPESHKFWRVYAGMKIKYLFFDQYKLESSQLNYKKNNLSDLNDLHYGVYVAAGWNTWNIYAYYGLNPLFKSSAKLDNQTIDISSANFGIMFYIL